MLVTILKHIPKICLCVCIIFPPWNCAIWIRYHLPSFSMCSSINLQPGTYYQWPLTIGSIYGKDMARSDRYHRLCFAQTWLWKKNDQIMLIDIHVTGVMSDNNGNSNDARFWAKVCRHCLRGKFCDPGIFSWTSITRHLISNRYLTMTVCIIQ